MKIYVIDTGVSSAIKSTRNRISGYTLCVTSSGMIKKDQYDDEEGHGTAVMRIIDRKVSDCEIIMVKFDVRKEKTAAFNTWLIYALEYIEKNETPDVST